MDSLLDIVTPSVTLFTRSRSENKLSDKRILIVTSCTKDKTPTLAPRKLLSTELWEGDDDRTLRDFGELEQYKVSAGKLYRGRQHQQLMDAVTQLRQVFGVEVVDLKIVSAGFGLIDEAEKIPPYEATFNELSASQITKLARKLGIPQKANQLMTNNQHYDCAFFLLGESYLQALELPFAQLPSFPCLFLTGPSSHKKVPRRQPYRFVRVSQDDAISFSCNLVGLKGYLFKLFVSYLLGSTSVTEFDETRLHQAHNRLTTFLTNPTAIEFLEILKPYRQPNRVSNRQRQQTQLMQPFMFDVATSRKQEVARNYGRPMKYFIPDWDDLVDPGYNFETDTGTKGKVKYHDEVYAHDPKIYDRPNYDGLLFSKSTIEDGVLKTILVREMGIHKFARFENKPILGDCGAFSYIAAERPPYETKEILDYYESLGFDYGVSIDHLIIPAFYAVKDFRYELTRNNAREFIELHKAGGYNFTPVGVAQGWSPETYRQSVAELLDWGYQYVALGGLARAKTEDIYEVLKTVAPVLNQDTDLHLFGVARDRNGDEMQRFREFGVTSFDSASYLRRAWLSENTNYFTEEGKRYAAIRIPPMYAASPRVKSILADGLATLEQLQKLEHDALWALREYAQRRLDLETTLQTVLEIDRLEQYNYVAHQQTYRQVLTDRPWEKCSCAICRSIGIEVIIFRRNDRNRRRGFHNTYAFYKQFQQLIERNLP